MRVPGRGFQLGTLPLNRSPALRSFANRGRDGWRHGHDHDRDDHRHHDRRFAFFFFPYWYAIGGYGFPYPWYAGYRTYFEPAPVVPPDYDPSYLPTDWQGPYMDYAEPEDGTAQGTDRTAAFINLIVPSNAEVWFEGQKMELAGKYRQFESPPLSPGRDYAYGIQARWNQNGEPVTESRRLIVRAGDRLMVRFTENDR
jgi:uncharacterized protein (TIGR03000 family)